MKVIAINGSPKMDEGNTARILNPFLDGMKEAGAEIELFYTSKLKIKPCQAKTQNNTEKKPSITP
jgi:multimeric flavodoxin WrbA